MKPVSDYYELNTTMNWINEAGPTLLFEKKKKNLSTSIFYNEQIKQRLVSKDIPFSW